MCIQSDKRNRDALKLSGYSSVCVVCLPAGAMLVHPQPMCPRLKILGCCIPWAKCPLAILPLTEPSHP
jgi:hypothetical protein